MCIGPGIKIGARSRWGCELVFRSLIALALRLPVGDSESGDYPGYSPRRTSIYLVGCLRFIEVPRGAVARALRKIQRMNLNFVEPVSRLGDSESRPSLCLYIYITSGLSLVEGWFSVHYIVTGGSWIEETALLDSALEAVYHRSYARYSTSKCLPMTQNCGNQRIYSKHKVCVLIPQSR